jgi:hypothetical protein
MKLLLLFLALVVQLAAQNPNTACWPAAACTDANLFVYSNNISRSGAMRLSGAINSAVTSIVVNDATGVLVPVILTIDAEILHCATLTTNTFSGCVRGREGSTAVSHSDATVVRGYLTAYTLNQYAKEIMALQTSLQLAANRVVLGGGTTAPTVTAANSNTTHALFATAGAPAFRALADADIPNTITVDLATLATTATTANAGDSATAFFPSGTIEVARLPAATTTASGIAEAAIDTEVTTGTDAARYVTPDALAGSTIFGVRTVEVELFSAGTAAATGDGKAYFRIPASLNGMNLVTVKASCYTAGTTGTINIDIDRCATAATGNICSGTVVDVLSTNITIDSGENDTATAAAAAVINTANDDVATGQFYRFNVDAIHTTPCQGVLVELAFQLP